MKKTLLMFVFLLVSTALFAQDDDMPKAAKDYRAAVKSYLQVEGFSPTIDEDGYLSFKKEGVLYWITFRSEDPVYVEFHMAGLNGDGLDVVALYLAVNELNLNKRCAKAVVNDNGDVEYSVEFYSTSPDQFKGSFYRYMNVLQVARDYVLEKYEVFQEDEDE